MRRRLVTALTVLAIGLAVSVTLLACCLLWKPSGLRSEDARPDFFTVIASSPLPSTAGTLLADGAATLSLSQADLEDILAALVDRTNASVPGPIASHVRAKLPPEIEKVAALTIEPSGINLILKCRETVTFYLGLTLMPRIAADGAVAFDVRSSHAGVLPLPVGLARRAAGALTIPRDKRIDLRITRFELSDGAITMDLETDQGGSQWLKTLSEQ